MGFYDLDTGKSVSRTELYRKDGEAAIAAARQLEETAKAESRGFRPDEQTEYDRHVAEAKQCVEAMKTARSDEQFVKQVGEMFGGGLDGTPGGTPKGNDRLSFKGMGRQAAERILGGQKALAPSGATVVPQQFEGDPIALGRVPQSLLAVLPVKVHTSPEYAYLAQTSRVNNAAVVAEGAVKPTTLLGLTRVEKTLQVIAHLSEPIPRFWIQDVAALEQFVNAELEFGLGVALEAKVLTDTVGTSGAQVQSYSTSVLQTLRKALTKVEVAGYTPGVIVLHPTDFEGIELALASVTAIEHLNLPYESASRRLFGTPIVTTIAATAGVGVVLATDAVVVDVDGRSVDIAWSETSTADSFARNQTVCRCEMRANSSQLSPLGIVVADLTP